MRKCKHEGTLLDEYVDVELGLLGKGQCASCGAEVSTVEMVNALTRVVMELRRQLARVKGDVPRRSGEWD